MAAIYGHQTWVYYGLPNLSQVIAIDSSNEVYVAGRESWPLGQDVFVHIATLKYDPNGNQLWEDNTAQGGEDGDVHVEGFAIDNSGNVYLVADYIGAAQERYQTYKYYQNGTLPGMPTIRRETALVWLWRLALDQLQNVIVTGRNAYYNPSYCYGTYKLSTNGTYLWSALYPNSHVGNSTATSVCTDLQIACM